MPELADLKRRFAMRLRLHPIRSGLEMTDEGLVLGAETLLARRAPPVRTLALQGEGPRIMAMLASAFGRVVSPYILEKMQRASELWAEGERALAMIHLAHARLPPVERNRKLSRSSPQMNC